MNISKPFLEAVQQPDHQIDLAYCALLISQAIQPGLDIKPFQDQLHSINNEFDAKPTKSAAELLSLIHDKNNLKGDTRNYFTVENSLLDRVLIKGSGIPISLGLIYINTAKNSSMSVFGINFPGHSLIGTKMNLNEDITIIDPYSGKINTKEECYDLIRNLQEEPFQPNDPLRRSEGKR